PLLTIELLMLANAHEWFGIPIWGFASFLIPTIYIILFAFIGFEVHLRVKHLHGIQRFPWFSPVMAVAAFTILSVGDWMRPVVTGVQNWSYARQAIVWVASNNETFALSLSGSGNIANHRFSSGYLNWSGEESAGIAKIEFKPIKFQWWQNGKKVFAEGT